MGYRIPNFRNIETLAGIFRLPSGRLAELIKPIEVGHKCARLRYLDDGEEILVLKTWLASCAVVV